MSRSVAIHRDDPCAVQQRRVDPSWVAASVMTTPRPLASLCVSLHELCQGRPVSDRCVARRRVLIHETMHDPRSEHKVTIPVMNGCVRQKHSGLSFPALSYDRVRCLCICQAEWSTISKRTHELVRGPIFRAYDVSDRLEQYKKPTVFAVSLSHHTSSLRRIRAT